MIGPIVDVRFVRTRDGSIRASIDGARVDLGDRASSDLGESAMLVADRLAEMQDATALEVTDLATLRGMVDSESEAHRGRLRRLDAMAVLLRELSHEGGDAEHPIARAANHYLQRGTVAAPEVAR